jgi:hypothetical protein
VKRPKKKRKEGRLRGHSKRIMYEERLRGHSKRIRKQGR